MRRRRTISGGLVAGVLSALAIAALSACTDGGDVAGSTTPAGPADPIPVSADVAGAGAAIAPGYSVPEGATLLGRAIPKVSEIAYLGEPIPDAGWDAYLAVPGDPRPVVASLVEQAEADELDVRSWALSSEQHPSDTVCGPTDEAYRCAAVGADSFEAPRRTIAIEFDRRNDEVPSSWVRVSLSDSERPEWGTVLDGRDLPTIAALGPEPIAVPSGWVLPEVGEEIGEGLGPADLYRFEVVPGSRVVAPVMTQPAGPGYTVLVAVTGDLDEVIDGYVRQHDGVEVLEPITTPGGAMVRTYGGGGAGGSDFTLRSVDAPGVTPILRIEVGYD